MIGGAVVTVVNHLRLSEPLPDSAVDAFAAAFPEMQRLGCKAAQLLKVADDHVILVLVFDSSEAAATVSETIGGPLMREHVIPLLASATERSVGEAIFSLGI
jgi:hypothetical protein